MNALGRLVLVAKTALGSVLVGAVGWLCATMIIVGFVAISAITGGDSHSRDADPFLVVLTVASVWQVGYAVLSCAVAYRYSLSSGTAFSIGYIVCIIGDGLLCLLCVLLGVGRSTEGNSPAILVAPAVVIVLLQLAIIIYPAAFGLTAAGLSLRRSFRRHGWPRWLFVPALLVTLMVLAAIGWGLIGLLFMIVAVTDGAAAPIILVVVAVSAIAIAAWRGFRMTRSA